MRGSRLHGNDGGVARSGETFKTVSFGLIPSHSSRRSGPGFTLILAFSPQGRRDLQGAGTGTRVGGATAGTGLSRWDGTGSGGVPWLRPGSDRVGVGLATLVGTLGTGTCGVCKWVTRATGRNRSLAAASESSYSLCGIFATAYCRIVVVSRVERPGGRGEEGGGRDRDALGAWSGVVRSGETFNSLPFPTISFHSHCRRWRWGRVRGSAFAGVAGLCEPQ